MVCSEIFVTFFVTLSVTLEPIHFATLSKVGKTSLYDNKDYI